MILRLIILNTKPLRLTCDNHKFVVSNRLASINAENASEYDFRGSLPENEPYLRVTGVLGGSVVRICFSRTRADKSSVGSI